MSVDTKVRESIDQLAHMTEAAEASKAVAEGMVKIGRHLSLIETHDTDETREMIASALGQDGSNKWTTTLEAVRAMREAVDGLSVSEADGKPLADSLAAVMDWLEADLQEQAKATLARWYEAAPKLKSSRVRTGEHAANDLGFEVKVTCQKCRSVVGSTKKDNANSLRFQVLTHNDKEHGHKPTKGEAGWQGITEAILNVFKGSNSQEGGGYTVSKVNGS